MGGTSARCENHYYPYGVRGKLQAKSPRVRVKSGLTRQAGWWSKQVAVLALRTVNEISTTRLFEKRSLAMNSFGLMLSTFIEA